MKQFGGKITRKLEERYAKSDNWREGKFQNLEETKMDISFHSLPKLLYKQFCEKEGREPAQPIPVTLFDLQAFQSDDEHIKFIWYGHSVLLLKIAKKTILIDPMLGSNASPIGPFSTNRFSENTLELIDEFPDIDLLLLTHDHYDHLDLASIKKLKAKVRKYYVALGVKRHLTYWGIDESVITEFDWWDEQNFGGTTITFTPSRHFSGRGLTDRSKSLWGGWVFKTDKEKVYFSGDGGYGDHFKEVGKRLGPFDIGFMECGQYNEKWHEIHMYPEESVLAAMDAGVKKAMPVHWGAFALAQHTWNDPVERFTNEAKKQKLSIITPPIGSIFKIPEHNDSNWWKKF